jgi:uncharacterized small protein (DUF1192 family)
MDADDVFARKPKPSIVIGEDLAMLSVEELHERIATLTAEIARLEAAIAAKQSSRAAADAVFGRSPAQG